ncbi:hypothetical protein RFI_29984 [Reticulomyxa filosa]|uniref:Uncharacterized protein n=1 Tax=Reticulomyxa filosa TaxID=46433 RepID=X6LZT5_RETFI|nr:hypothetical protein RFI_29984 [Reticulomyxa filosa]|eukprot:ETO07408.1 hypothetical protein RFI_29984 [Reticulomyxa filosa]
MSTQKIQSPIPHEHGFVFAEGRKEKKLLTYLLYTQQSWTSRGVKVPDIDPAKFESAHELVDIVMSSRVMDVCDEQKSNNEFVNESLSFCHQAVQGLLTSIYRHEVRKCESEDCMTTSVEIVNSRWKIGMKRSRHMNSCDDEDTTISPKQSQRSQSSSMASSCCPSPLQLESNAASSTVTVERESPRGNTTISIENGHSTDLDNKPRSKSKQFILSFESLFKSQLIKYINGCWHHYHNHAEEYIENLVNSVIHDTNGLMHVSCIFKYWFGWCLSLGRHVIQAIFEYGAVQIKNCSEWRAFVALICLQVNEAQRKNLQAMFQESAFRCDDKCKLVQYNPEYDFLEFQLLQGLTPFTETVQKERLPSSRPTCADDDPEHKTRDSDSCEPHRNEHERDDNENDGDNEAEDSNDG